MKIGSIDILDDVLPEDDFELADGEIVNNIIGLLNSLKKMDSHIFSLHVTKSRNDFAEWIFEAYNEEKLVKKLFKTTSKQRMILIIEKYISESRKEKNIVPPKSRKDILNKIGEVNYEM